MAKKPDHELTPEELEQKRKSSTRLLALLIVLDILMIAYVVYEIITAVKK